MKKFLPITGGLWVIKGVFTSSLRSWPAENTWPEWDRTMTRRSETSLFNSEYSPSSMASDSAFLRQRKMFYLTTHSTHFIYGYMVSDIWLRTILIVRKETRCRHIGYSYRLTARVLLYPPSHRQDSLCYTSCGALAGTRNSSMGPPHEGSIQWPIAPWANALPLSYVPLRAFLKSQTI